MKTLKRLELPGARVNVLLAHSTNFQHTSLLKCSLKLNLHHLKAYEPRHHCSLMVKAQRPKAKSLSSNASLWPGDGAPLRYKTREPELYLPEIKMTVIIGFSVVRSWNPCHTEHLPPLHGSNFSKLILGECPGSVLLAWRILNQK